MKRINQRARLIFLLLFLDYLYAEPVVSEEAVPATQETYQTENAKLCNSLDSCLSDLSTPFEGNYPKTEAIVINLQKTGRPAVKPILQLLQSKYPSVQYKASYVLSKMQQNLLPEDLPDIKFKVYRELLR